MSLFIQLVNKRQPRWCDVADRMSYWPLGWWKVIFIIHPVNDGRAALGARRLPQW